MPGHQINADVPMNPGHPECGLLADRPVCDRPAGTQFATGVDATELMQRLHTAEREVAELKHALASQRLIGVAIGLLAHRFACSPEQAWRLLVRLSQTSNVKVREVARILADAHSGADVTADADVLAILATQLPGQIRSPQQE